MNSILVFFISDKSFRDISIHTYIYYYASKHSINIFRKVIFPPRNLSSVVTQMFMFSQAVFLFFYRLCAHLEKKSY